MNDDRLMWMDLEMTGLDPDSNRIIEVAALVTDGQLNVLAEGPTLVIHQTSEHLDTMDDWNKRHHRESGLLERVRVSTESEGSVEEQLLAFARSHCAERSAPLAGNSIYQDRRFIAKHMPRLDAFLHYRLVDVSTVKELVRRWYPAVFEKRPHKKGNHRAMEDILESIEELRFYREHAFIPLVGTDHDAKAP